jgi:Flp pilus assembly protein TadB
VTAAWVTVGLLVLGLPLLAWWVAGRRFWARLRPGAESDPWRDAVRRHGLSAAEAARLAREVPRGSAFEDPRLRRAAVDWAETLLAQEPPRPRTRRGRVLTALFVVWATGVFAYLVNRVVVGRPEDVNWVGVVAFSLFAVYAVRRRRALRRTIALNSERAVGV